MAGDRRVSIHGGVVRRPVSPWTETVHSLLAHLYAAGLPVPEPLGVDGSHEILRLVPGDAVELAWPHQSSLSGVRSAGSLLRAIHVATQSWTPPPAAQWAVPSEGGPVVCHGDPKPTNMAWRDGVASGLFDWDMARPASEVSDVAYALYWLAPFDVDEAERQRRHLPETRDATARIEALLDGYGWTGPLDAMRAVADRRAQAVDEVVYLGERGHMPHAAWVDAGWPDRWRTRPRLL